MLKLFYNNGILLDLVYPKMRMLPDFVLRKISHRIVVQGIKEVEEHNIPHRLTFFVTNKCNLKCSHCFYSAELNNSKEEMNVEQIKAAAISLRNRISQLILTGGEPFLRKDIVEICSVFEKHGGVSSVTIMTNGFTCEKILKDVRELIKKTSLQLNFQISIDGLPAYHDENRGIRGGYDYAVKTIVGLQNLDSRNRIQRISTATAIGQGNLKSLEETICALRKIKGVFHGFTFVRGSSYIAHGVRDKSLLNNFDPPENGLGLNKDQMKEALEILKNNFWRKTKPMLYHAINQMVLNIICEKKEEGVRCMAGIADYVIYPNGDVALCEMMKPFGNVRAYDYDLLKFWENEYGIYKKKIAGCRCTHDCNIASMIKFDEERLNSILNGTLDSN